VYPFPDGYSYFLGECADADPEGVDPTASPPEYYPTGLRPAPFSSPPGGSANVSLVQPAYDVTITEPGGNNTTRPSVGATVSIVHDKAPGCSTAVTTYVAGTTDAAGKIRIVMPFGSWKFKAVRGGNSGTSPAVKFDPTRPVPAPITLRIS
jgi:hypothetical protein